MIRHRAFLSLLLAFVIFIFFLSLFWITGSGETVKASTVESVSLEEHLKVYRRDYQQAIPVVLTGVEAPASMAFTGVEATALDPVPAPTEIPAPLQAEEPLQAQIPIPIQDLASLQAQAPAGPPLPPASIAFEQFATRVADGQAGVLRGVYVEGVLELEVVQQPQGDAPYVSNEYGFATQFQMAARYGITGLLAHNYLSGELFSQLAVGQEILLVYGDGSSSRYTVSGIHNFQKLEPESLTSRYIDLSTGEELSTEQLFNRFYKGEDHVTFQTCVKNGEEWSWGMLFVTATPVR